MTDSNTNHTIALIVILTMGAFFIRLPGLETRPMHGDEANQAYKTGILLEQGKYVYDPRDHHGPTLYYLTLIPAFLSGADSFEKTRETTYRIVPLIFGAGLIAVTLLLRPAFSTRALIASALLVAISPAFVFYSRYYIQETLLVFFTLAAIGFGSRFILAPSIKRGIALGTSLSLMHATKETAIIAYISMFAGLCAVFAANRNSDTVAELRKSITPRQIVALVATALTINILLYTAFFTNLRGPLDSILTYSNYLKRSDGAGLHDKPWYYYVQLLVYTNRGPKYWFSEALPVALGSLGILIALHQTRMRRAHPLILFLAVYTLVMILIYSVIPYKTPWTMLSLYHGLLLLAGYAVAVIAEKLKNVPAESICALLLLAGLSHLAYQTYLTNHVIPADPRNPYVYAHTSSAHLDLIDRVYGIQAIHPDPDSMSVKIIQPDNDYWPLPWYLRKIEHVGFYPEIPESPDADVIIAAPSLRTTLAEKLSDDYQLEIGGLRPSVLRAVYIKRELWDAYMETRK
ncbi:MAG TPA: TIGR03663 family protein [Candidatus Hydrogenedentes bacterium]|nr:TIGR03663 family protein [Candidatus Hydrogenedentota bacterium]